MVQPTVMLFTGVPEGFLDASTPLAEDMWHALTWARAEGLPVVLASHHTRAELAVLAPLLRQHVFVIENGGGITLPPEDEAQAGQSDVTPCEVLPLASPYHEVVDVLRRVAARVRVDVQGFDDLSAADVARACHVTLERARKAKCREFDEPFRVLTGTPVSWSALWHGLRSEGLRCTPGAAFHHVTGGGGLRAAVALVKALFNADGPVPLTVGIGTDLRDRALLRSVDVPIVIPSDENGMHPGLLHKLAHARVTSSGRAGWTEAVTEALLMMEAHAATRRLLSMRPT